MTTGETAYSAPFQYADELPTHAAKQDGLNSEVEGNTPESWLLNWPITAAFQSEGMVPGP